MPSIQLKDVQNYFPTQLALWSFIIGSIILLLHMIFPRNGDIVDYGLIYTLLALFINGLTFIMLVLQLFFYWKKREEITFQMLILLANLPIALLYFYIVCTYN